MSTKIETGSGGQAAGRDIVNGGDDAVVDVRIGSGGDGRQQVTIGAVFNGPVHFHFTLEVPAAGTDRAGPS